MLSRHESELDDTNAYDVVSVSNRLHLVVERGRIMAFSIISHC
jgi:hypothetical protein